LKYESKERNIDLEKKKQVKKNTIDDAIFLKNLRFWALTRDKKIKRNEKKNLSQTW
jgi:hypothetical protein